MSFLRCFEVRSAGVEAGAVRGLQALRATLLTAVEAARDGDLQEALGKWNSNGIELPLIHFIYFHYFHSTLFRFTSFSLSFFKEIDFMSLISSEPGDCHPSAPCQRGTDRRCAACTALAKALPEAEGLASALSGEVGKHLREAGAVHSAMILRETSNLYV